MSIQIKAIALGLVSANCYIILDEESGKSAIIDVSEVNNRVKDTIAKMGIEKFDYILFTHGHFDHIMGAKKIKDIYGGQIVIHQDDEPCLSSDELSLAQKFGTTNGFKMKADITVKDGDVIDFGSEKIEVIHTPGHTIGGVCFKIGNKLFTGDTLFKGTIGRTDFPNGSYLEIIKSVKKLASLEGDYDVYPGHEGLTTLENERKTNIYMR